MANCFVNPRRRAVTAILVSIMLPVLLGMAALTIDVGRLVNTRVELQNAADAVALAAAQDLGGLDPHGSIQTATATAATFIGLNPVWNNQAISAYETVFGQALLSADGTRIDFTPNVIPANSVRVTVHYDLPYTFARIFGLASKTVSASATAGIGPRDFMIVIDASGSMTKQSVDLDVCADLDTLGIPHPPGDPLAKPGKGPCVMTARALTYDGSMGGPEFWNVFNVGDSFLPPNIRVLPMKSAKDAAAFGVDVVENAGYDDQIGTASFAPGAPWAQELTTDYPLVRARIRGLTKYGGSDIDIGILAGRAELLSVRTRTGADRVMVVFADGQSNAAAALAAAQVAANDDISIYCVGLGTNVDQALLDGIAAIGGGTAIYVLNNVDETVYGPQLKQAFQSIASSAVQFGLLE